jgi:hypothetical protein
LISRNWQGLPADVGAAADAQHGWHALALPRLALPAATCCVSKWVLHKLNNNSMCSVTASHPQQKFVAHCNAQLFSF